MFSKEGQEMARWAQGWRQEVERERDEARRERDEARELAVELANCLPGDRERGNVGERFPWIRGRLIDPNTDGWRWGLDTPPPPR